MSGPRLARAGSHPGEEAMAWFAALCEKYPEFGVFLAIGLGYLIGEIKIRGVGLGSVTGSLIAGLLIGYVVHVPISDAAKSMLFLLFLFGIGYSSGPTFFKSMRGGGWRWAVLAIVTPTAGLFTAWGVASALDLDLGFAAGLLSGALTESPAMGTASEAIKALALPDAETQRLIAHIAVADAMCYVFGTFGVIAFCSMLGPKLLGIDLKVEARRVEQELGLVRAKPGVVSAWSAFVVRAYRIAPGMRSTGLRIADAEKLAPVRASSSSDSGATAGSSTRTPTSRSRSATSSPCRAGRKRSSSCWTGTSTKSPTPSSSTSRSRPSRSTSRRRSSPAARSVSSRSGRTRRAACSCDGSSAARTSCPSRPARCSRAAT
jgi:AspT/YidE/YbjL antiporter-like protein